MSRWFRMYDETLDDAKVQRLPDPLFRAWVNLLCLASKGGGTLPSIGDIAFALRKDEAWIESALTEFKARGLIDECDGEISPHNWRKRQFKSDADPTAAERQARKRAKESPIVTRGITDHVTRDITDASHRSDTETDTEYVHSRADAPVPASCFKSELMKAYAAAGSMHFPDTHHAEIWIKRGYDPEICLSVVKSGLTRKPGVPLKYFDGAIADAHVVPVGNVRARAGPTGSAGLRGAMDYLASVIENEQIDGSKSPRGNSELLSINGGKRA